jgi:LCP family protein required for cell wall assembly
MLLRVDPDNNVLSLLSLPRDLKVAIPGYGTGKLNEAFSYGGVPKTLETVKDLTGLQINHVVNVDFQGFADAVNAIDCVYVDVDRHYFNDNSSGIDPYATINVNAGYQRLCGQNALDYVRYRHTDTDIVRAARQQDFLREARQQVPPKEVLPIIGGDTGSKLIDIFTKYTQSDVDNAGQILGALRSFIGVIDVPVKQVSFQGELGPSYVTATQEQIDKVVHEFLATDQPEPSEVSGGGSGKSSNKGSGDSGNEKNPAEGADVISADDSYARFGRTSARRLKFPVFVPTVVAPNSTYSADSRQYDIKDLSDKKQAAYKMVIEYSVSDVLPQYYGVQGTTWGDPPILADPSETQTIDGKDYDLYYDGDRLRMVAWHDSEGNSYWVQNTLERLLDNDQMIAIATSFDEAHG